MAQQPPVTGVSARYYGSQQGSTTYYYWVQAIYPSGNASLSLPANTGSKCIAALTAGNFVQVQWNPAPGAIGYLVWRSTSSTTPGTGGSNVFIATSETGIKDDGTLTVITTSPRYDGFYVAKALYNFAADGGAISTITPALSDSIPANAIVCGGFANPTTAFVGATATIAIGTSAGSSTTALKGATAVASYSIDAILALTPVMTAASSFKMSATGQITITVAVAALTAGVMEIFVFYILPTNP